MLDYKGVRLGVCTVVLYWTSIILRVPSWYVSLCMNVPSQTEILLLWLKIPVILDLIEFEIFMWRLLKIAFPGF